ncbi:MAG: S1-like domain-containing RNA-binding protein [Opitutales bacterium]|jgi:uncharacterized protein|nr:S1-like domain-containing RNA-binding protein [Opitutales bacterium]MDG2168162.1 S1-like domain-containing RNA-binding protein [Opitutales bacterium]
MVDLGKLNSLKPVRDSANGRYLDGGELGEILLPKKFVTEELRQAESISVFVYKDSEDRLVATTETPKAMVGQFATLEVLSANPKVGAFLDWGLSKDLLLPFREQKSDPMEGDYCVVYILVDELSGRIIASERLTEFLDQEPAAYESEEEVDLLVIDETPLGYKAIVNDKHLGLLYHTDLSDSLEYGQWIVGYVSQVREDGKIDLRRDQKGHKRIEPIGQEILDALKANGGALAFNDKSSPEAIRAEFDVSKQAFKRALGVLYKAKQIQFKEDGIVLSEASD